MCTTTTNSHTSAVLVAASYFWLTVWNRYKLAACRKAYKKCAGNSHRAANFCCCCFIPLYVHIVWILQCSVMQQYIVVVVILLFTSMQHLHAQVTRYAWRAAVYLSTVYTTSTIASILYCTVEVCLISKCLSVLVKSFHDIYSVTFSLLIGNDWLFKFCQSKFSFLIRTIIRHATTEKTRRRKPRLAKLTTTVLLDLHNKRDRHHHEEAMAASSKIKNHDIT
jgi:hypothetical protein